MSYLSSIKSSDYLRCSVNCAYHERFCLFVFVFVVCLLGFLISIRRTTTRMLNLKGEKAIILL